MRTGRYCRRKTPTAATGVPRGSLRGGGRAQELVEHPLNHLVNPRRLGVVEVPRLLAARDRDQVDVEVAAGAPVEPNRCDLLVVRGEQGLEVRRDRAGADGHDELVGVVGERQDVEALLRVLRSAVLLLELEQRLCDLCSAATLRKQAERTARVRVPRLVAQPPEARCVRPEAVHVQRSFLLPDPGVISPEIDLAGVHLLPQDDAVDPREPFGDGAAGDGHVASVLPLVDRAALGALDVAVEGAEPVVDGLELQAPVLRVVLRGLDAIEQVSLRLVERRDLALARPHVDQCKQVEEEAHQNEPNGDLKGVHENTFLGDVPQDEDT